MPSSMSSAMPGSMTQSRPVSTASSSTASSQTAAAVQLLDPAEFAAAIAGDRVTINVRVPDEGSLPDTDLALPFDQINVPAAELPQDRNTPLAIYCMTGHMSAIAGAELAALGYTASWNSVAGWKRGRRQVGHCSRPGPDGIGLSAKQCRRRRADGNATDQECSATPTVAPPIGVFVGSSVTAYRDGSWACCVR